MNREKVMCLTKIDNVVTMGTSIGTISNLMVVNDLNKIFAKISVNDIVIIESDIIPLLEKDKKPYVKVIDSYELNKFIKLIDGVMDGHISHIRNGALLGMYLTNFTS